MPKKNTVVVVEDWEVAWRAKIQQRRLNEALTRAEEVAEEGKIQEHQRKEKKMKKKAEREERRQIKKMKREKEQSMS